MNKEELLQSLFSEEGNIPQAVVYKCEITTENLDEIQISIMNQSK